VSRVSADGGRVSADTSACPSPARQVAGSQPWSGDPAHRRSRRNRAESAL